LGKKLNNLFKYIKCAWKGHDFLGTDDTAIYLFSGDVEGYRHYLKFEPCRNCGLVPSFGKMTNEEFKNWDQKNYEAAMEKVKKHIENATSEYYATDYVKDKKTLN